MAAAVIVALVGGFVYLAGRSGPAPHRHVWLTEKTTAAAGGVPDVLTTALYAAAADGGGELVSYAVGAEAARVTPVSLTVLREGAPEKDPALRDGAIAQRLGALRTNLDAAAVGEEGHSLYAGLKAAADEAATADGRVDVWFSSTFLSSTVDPFAIAQLTAGDPKAVVAEIMTGPISRVDLRNVDLHPIMLAPVGSGQQPLTAADEAWRTDFVTALGGALGADVSPPVSSAAKLPPWERPSAVPLIEPLALATPAAGPSGCTTVCVIDNLSFRPDTAALLDEAATREQVRRFAAGLTDRPGIQVTGYTAAYGAAESSRALSLARAEVIASFLRADGFPDSALDVRGLGHDTRADPDEGPQSAAQRVVILKIIPRPAS